MKRCLVITKKKSINASEATWKWVSNWFEYQAIAFAPTIQHVNRKLLICLQLTVVTLVGKNWRKALRHKFALVLLETQKNSFKQKKSFFFNSSVLRKEVWCCNCLSNFWLVGWVGGFMTMKYYQLLIRELKVFLQPPADAANISHIASISRFRVMGERALEIKGEAYEIRPAFDYFYYCTNFLCTLLR